MPESVTLIGFIAAALVVLLIPGPGVLYIVARSLAQGRRAGLISVLGLSTGAILHVVAATAGLSAVLLTSAVAFGIVKTLGAGYLIYLGVKTLLARRQNTALPATATHSLQRLFTDGVVISALNPKIAVFFLAFLPQFVDADIGPIPQQVLFLGLIYVLLGLCTDGAYALLAGNFRRWMGNRMLRGSLPRYLSGLVYIGLGVSTALVDRQRI